MGSLHLSLLSLAVINTTAKRNMSEKSFSAYRLLPLLRKAREWAQGRNLEEEADAEVIEECCSGACSPAVVLSMLSYTAQDHQPTVSMPLLYQSVAKKMPRRHVPD